MSWQIDPVHSHIQFTVRHMMIAKVRGSFETFSGMVNFVEDNPMQSIVEVDIDAASVNTREEQRDNHLRSGDFLDVENYPQMTYVCRRIEQDDPNNGRLIGDLTIRDVTNEVVLDVHFVGKAVSPWGTESAGFEASTTISRKDWGLEWNQALETGGWLVGDKVKIDIDLEIVKVPEEEAEATA
ncbi:MAG: YceI family protein [Candidatus Promineifilaceae bacterium]|nr:YceI family protein [Candidatus Promineifilaceae bacterium]